MPADRPRPVPDSGIAYIAAAPTLAKDRPPQTATVVGGSFNLSAWARIALKEE